MEHSCWEGAFVSVARPPLTVTAHSSQYACTSARRCTAAGSSAADPGQCHMGAAPGFSTEETACAAAAGGSPASTAAYSAAARSLAAAAAAAWYPAQVVCAYCASMCSNDTGLRHRVLRQCSTPDA